MDNWLTAKELITANTGNLIAQADRAAIRCEADAEKAADLVKVLQTQIRKIEEKRKQYTAPLLESKRVIDADAKLLREPLEKAKTSVSKMLTNWLNQQRAEAEAARAAERAKREAEALETAETLERAGMADQAEQAIEKAVEETAVAQVKREPIARGDLGGAASLRTVWKWRVTNVAAVPAAFVVVDAGKVRAFMADRWREIEARADELELSGVKRQAYIDQELEKMTLPGIGFYRESSAVVR